jgi:hypothetical protein
MRHSSQLQPTHPPSFLSFFSSGALYNSVEMSETSEPFETAFRRAWGFALERGALRNPRYRDAKRRTLLGGVVAQFDPSHLISKRPPSIGDAIRVKKPHDPSAFNFCRVAQLEHLCEIDGDRGHVHWKDASDTTREAATADGHLLVVNVNPLWEGHGLFVPFVDRLLPQVLTCEGIRAALEFAARGGAGIRLGFNSLGAFASVNHLHFHVGFMRDTFPSGMFPCESASRLLLVSTSSLSLHKTTSWPLPMLVYAVSKGADASDARREREVISSALDITVHALQEANIAHNVLVSNSGLLVYLVPRQLQRGGPSEDGSMAVALAEICGLAVTYSEESFHAMNQDLFDRTLRSAALDPAEFDRIVAIAMDAVVTASATAVNKV